MNYIMNLDAGPVVSELKFNRQMILYETFIVVVVLLSLVVEMLWPIAGDVVAHWEMLWSIGRCCGPLGDVVAHWEMLWLIGR